MIRRIDDKLIQLTYKVPLKVVPPVNGFLVLGAEPVLIDGGTSDDETFDAFKADLAQLGLKTSDITNVLVTHNHIDHIGMASRLAAEHKDLKVRVHEEEWYMVSATDEEREGFRQTLASVICSWGVPAEVVELMKEKLVKYLRLGGGISASQVLPYPSKEKFKAGGIELEAIHCPGHTEGLVCLWWPETGNIFSNDHVLEDITPNPTMYIKPRLGKRCGLADYLNSLSFIEDLPVKRVLPGHGLPFSDLKGRIEEVRGLAHQRRQKLIQNLVVAQEPLNVLELTLKTWGEMDPVSTFLASREAHGFMEMLADEGVVSMEMDGFVNRYTIVKSAAKKELERQSFATK
jgi:glyoxylase-like metal-dependent hydrolase (beta-lactamase superfamily II)